MVHRSADSRLLANLISHEKEYTNQLQSLLNLSHASFNSLSAYAASSPPPASQVILAVAGSLSNVDNALRLYAAAVEEWTKYLKELKDLEDEVGNVMRDREILVTRLLKASKSTPKPSSNRDSLMFSSSPPASSSTLPGPMSANKKLQTAQAELQACEAHLAKKELELDGKRSSAIRDGLRIRFRALGQCGWRWSEIGKEVEVVLGFGEQGSAYYLVVSRLIRFLLPCQYTLNHLQQNSTTVHHPTCHQLLHRNLLPRLGLLLEVLHQSIRQLPTSTQTLKLPRARLLHHHLPCTSQFLRLTRSTI
ncbi:hypothetical protein DFJ43DRAFT_1207341 [Lentinula guzmanii]|uniref:Uncharacterized protein n=1 Tax=Lentinula guzmanii TaxID=2804957 RepID=A0AA38MRE5_9AGAR|nr:hypothetical protein DFJ43DRAFT_1207341 [Lentinula guzmanii]